jgi:hypothetical protein
MKPPIYLPKLEDDEVLIIQTPPTMGSLAESLEKWLLSVEKKEFVIQLTDEVRVFVCKRDQIILDPTKPHRRL